MSEEDKLKLVIDSQRYKDKLEKVKDELHEAKKRVEDLNKY